MIPKQLSAYLAEKLWEDIQKHGELDEKVAEYAYCGTVLRAMEKGLEEGANKEIIQKAAAQGRPYFRILAVRLGREFQTAEDKARLSEWFAGESDVEIRMRLAFQILHRGAPEDEKVRLFDFIKGEKERYVSHMNYYFGGAENVFKNAGLFGERLVDEKYKDKIFMYLPYAGEVAGEELLPVLRNLCDDENPLVRNEAKAAVAAIERRLA